MIDALLEFLEKRMTLTPDSRELVRSVAMPRKAKKGEFLQRAGAVARHGHFIARGCLRSYSIDEKGKEHILQFAPEGWWLTDFASITTGAPSTIFIDALEDSDLLLIDWPSHDRLIQGIPGYAAAFAVGLQKGTTARELRILSSLSSAAEERYLAFLETHATLAQRVPLHMLASYLGMTPETLSRVRNQLSRRKRGSA
jgi:CRP-like cAMP-binding protein